MASIFDRFFGKHIRTSPNLPIRKGVSTDTMPPSSSTPPLTPLDLPQWVQRDFNRDNIRLLVFSDSDDIGLELIFDSKTVRVVPSDHDNVPKRPSSAATTINGRQSLSPVSSLTNPTTKPPTGPINCGGTRFRPTVTRFTHKGKQYELLKASNDIRNYADYIFGMMPLVFKGTGMKVHTRKSPLQIMMSRVFAVKVPERPDALMNSLLTGEPESVPNPNLNSFIGIHIHPSLSSNASVASSTISSIDVLGEDLTNQKFGRLYRRWLKCANRSMKQTPRPPGRRHRRCIGVAFIVTFPQNDLQKYKHFEEFFCTHSPLIENHFQKILIAAEVNINERNSIAAALLDKLFNFKNDLYTLYTRPRLLSPAWYILTQECLTMSKRRAIAQQLCSVIDLFTTPKYGDFLNCVLSAVLSYQISWLSTVSPSLVKSKQQVLFKSKADYMNSLQSFLQYSPLWAQLIDLFSAYGQPPYICRTVLVGTNSSLLDRLLYLLTYFIRPSYLTYQMPNTILSDTNDEQNRTYKKIRLYMDELITNSTQIQDIEPYSPIHSIHDENENLEDDIDILSGDESMNNNETEDLYPLTITSEDVQNSDFIEDDISKLLDSLVLRIEQKILNEDPTKIQSPKRTSVTLPSPIKPIVNSIPTKTLMSLDLFEPNYLGHETIEIINDYHVDLALSLISSVSSSYSSDFILQAIETSNTNEILRSIFTQHIYDTSENGGLFLNGEQIAASITIVINIDDMSVNLYSSEQNELARKQERTTLIQPIIDHARLAKQFLPADFFLLNMEDSLQEIYFQALAILKYIKSNNQSIYRHTSGGSFGDSASTTSLTSCDTDSKRSVRTTNTAIQLPSRTSMNSILTVDSSINDNNSELENQILRKFQLQRSDYLFLRNILNVLEMEQMQMIN